MSDKHNTRDATIFAMACAMWQEEARRAGTTGLYKARTPRAWLDQSADTREKWTGLAAVAYDVAERSIVNA